MSLPSLLAEEERRLAPGRLVDPVAGLRRRLVEPLREEIQASGRIDLGRQRPGRHTAGGDDGDREPGTAGADERARDEERDRDDRREDERALDVGRVPGEVPVRELADREARRLEVGVLVEPQLGADDEEQSDEEAGDERRRARQRPREHRERRREQDRDEVDHVALDDQVRELRREERSLDRGVGREADACRDPDGHECEALRRRPDPARGEGGDRRHDRQDREPDRHRRERPHAVVEGAMLLEARRRVPGVRAVAGGGADGEGRSDREDDGADPVPCAPGRAPAAEPLGPPEHGRPCRPRRPRAAPRARRGRTARSGRERRRGRCGRETDGRPRPRSPRARASRRDRRAAPRRGTASRRAAAPRRRRPRPRRAQRPRDDEPREPVRGEDRGRHHEDADQLRRLAAPTPASSHQAGAAR